MVRACADVLPGGSAVSRGGSSAWVRGFADDVGGVCVRGEQSPAAG